MRSRRTRDPFGTALIHPFMYDPFWPVGQVPHRRVTYTLVNMSLRYYTGGIRSQGSRTAERQSSPVHHAPHQYTQNNGTKSHFTAQLFGAEIATSINSMPLRVTRMSKMEGCHDEPHTHVKDGGMPLRATYAKDGGIRIGER